MQLKLKLKTQILLFILSTSITIFIVAIGIVSFKAREAAFNDAKRLSNTLSEKSAILVESALNTHMGSARSLAYAFREWEQFDTAYRAQYLNNIAKSVVEQRSDYLAVWHCWEMSIIKPGWGNKTGRESSVFYRDGTNSIKHKHIFRDIGGIKRYSGYHVVKKEMQEFIFEPYWCSYTFEGTDKVLETTVAAPIIRDGIFHGLVGIDISLDNIQELVSSIKPFENSYAFLVSNDGLYVSHPDKKLITKKISEINTKEEKEFHFSQNIRNGRKLSFTAQSNDGSGLLFITFSPLQIGDSRLPWSLGLVVPVDVITQHANANFLLSMLIATIGIIILLVVIILIANKITHPLVKVIESLKLLDKGVVDKKNKLKVQSQDEIGEIAISLNNLIDSLDNTVDFASEVGKGNLEYEHTLLGEDDKLGNSLLEMRNSLRKARKEEVKRLEEGRLQNWISTGLTKFGDILRLNINDLEELSFKIISELIEYTNINQGGFFIVDESNLEDVHIQLLSSYAFNRRKFIKKRIELREGYVGQCILEKGTIYLKNIPDGYIELGSGLGFSEPKYLLLVPLTFNDKVFGVLELTSFEPFEKHVIEFVERVSQSTASTISSIQINAQTAKLLKESRGKSEQMTHQEEEMRQNIEEMIATQEETQRRENSLNEEIEKLQQQNIVLSQQLEGLQDGGDSDSNSVQ